MDYIEKHYDYKNNVKSMELGVFNQLMSTNTQVNETVRNFVGKADAVKQDTISFEAIMASLKESK